MAGGRADGKWQLYDMSVDPGEVDDLSEAYPEVVESLLKSWQQYVDETGTVWGEDKIPIGQRGTTGWSATDDQIIGGE